MGILLLTKIFKLVAPNALLYLNWYRSAKPRIIEAARAQSDRI